MLVVKKFWAASPKPFRWIFPCMLLAFLLISWQPVQKKFVVVIDPGHGGKDPGAEASNTKKYDHEKDICLKVSIKLADYLAERLPNTKVILTRSSDKFLSLEERVFIANAAKANIFLSIHCNSNPIRSIHGTQLHLHDKASKESNFLAKSLDAEFNKKARRNSKGLQDSRSRGHDLYVLQYSEMPAVLVEIGFLSNQEEEKYLNSDHGQAVIASAMFRAVRTYKAHYKM